MDHNALLTIGQHFLTWIQYELAYHDALQKFLGVETAFDSQDAPLNYVLKNPILSLADDDAVQTHLMETALLKNKANNTYKKLVDFTNLFVETTPEFKRFEPNEASDRPAVQVYNIGSGFAEFIKSKNEEAMMNEEYKALILNGFSKETEAKRIALNEKFASVLNHYEALMKTAYAFMGLSDLDHDKLEEKFKTWFATA